MSIYEVTLQFQHDGSEEALRQDLRELITCSDMPPGWEATVVSLLRIGGGVGYHLSLEGLPARYPPE